MEYPPFAEQPNQYAGTLALADFAAQFQQQCLNIPPLNICADRPVVYQFKRFLVLAFHVSMILLADTMSNDYPIFVRLMGMTFAASPISSCPSSAAKASSAALRSSK